MLKRAHVRDEGGMTMVEVMVAMVVLVIGVLGTLVLVDGSASNTVKTTAREQGTNLARDLVERSRQAPYASMTMALAPATLRGMLPASDTPTALSGSTFQVTRRHVVYTVNVFACSIDDPTDGAGQGDATFCATPTTPSTPGGSTPGPAAAVNVLGIQVTAGGSLLDTVCNSLGVTAIASQLSGVLNPLVPTSVCPNASGTSVRFDPQPDDLRRVRISVSWTRGGTGSLSQTTLLTNPNQSS
ncbi:MAG TPA: prepilin-type N-terminal cleavage/methylation domain-containing protein [Solirubrobacteraceae bacterium]|nr:prepilin-type N-terminal cleavage/methylation domain-containing protein [Solirubrobacteraceae bacterium]